MKQGKSDKSEVHRQAEEEYWEAQREYNGVFNCHGGYVNEKGRHVRYEYSKTSLYCLTD